MTECPSQSDVASSESCSSYSTKPLWVFEAGLGQGAALAASAAESKSDDEYEDACLVR